jgi:hypothetical protein
MRSGPAAESTPAPESDPAQSDPASESGMSPDARHPGESAFPPAANTPPDAEAASESNAASEADAPESDPEPDPGTSPESDSGPQSITPSASESDSTPDSVSAADSGTVPDADAVPGGSAARTKRKPATPPAGLTGGIGCAALLLPLIAVAGAVLCFAAGVLSTATGCSPNGSALCSANGAWYAFALPVFVSPLVAAATAIGAVTVRRHRSTWLAVGYGIVFISIIIGLATASTGSN